MVLRRATVADRLTPRVSIRTSASPGGASTPAAVIAGRRPPKKSSEAALTAGAAFASVRWTVEAVVGVDVLPRGDRRESLQRRRRLLAHRQRRRLAGRGLSVEQSYPNAALARAEATDRGRLVALVPGGPLEPSPRRPSARRGLPRSVSLGAPSSVCRTVVDRRSDACVSQLLLTGLVRESVCSSLANSAPGGDRCIRFPLFYDATPPPVSTR